MKYKLIKLLPFENSPKIGYISSPNPLVEDKVHYWNGNWFNPENYPEFWEEVVVEKDYEILELSLQRSIKHQIVSALGNSEDYTISLLSCNGNKIHSVKRKDGEIFTIGDKVVGYNNSTAKIKTIDLVGEISLNIGTDKSEGFSLKNLKKFKKPLCTTEDGVDIYLGNKSWILHKNSWYLSPAAIVHNNSNWTPNENEAHWRFSTKEKAEEYILLNKPCLSYNEVLNATKIRNKNTFETLKDLVKSKIQQSV